jgi:hypothetical protein
MAHLLGSKACIDSLRADIDDLQNVVHDIVGKTGSIKYEKDRLLKNDIIFYIDVIHGNFRIKSRLILTLLNFFNGINMEKMKSIIKFLILFYSK